ncbi:MAG TPA: SagB/ThcOx family dehydrogenase [Gemmatimonadaceae bacterium]|nr:SagB/ThcOx family dehydrogenase [Gemmatimonadaceae bacterium]
MTAGRTPLDPALDVAAVYANSFRPLRPALAATGLRANALRHEALRHTQDARVAEEFLVNSRLRRRDVEFEWSVRGYFTDAGAAALSLLGREGRRGERAVPLPPSVAMRMELGESLRRRRSTRVYTGDAVPLSHLATLARAACGVTGHAGGTGGAGAAPRLALRSAPSGGGLYPIDLHIAALRVQGLRRGLYVYDPPGDRLWQTGDEAGLRALVASLAAPDQVIMTSQAHSICLLVARPWRSMRKYGARGMRHVLLEAGAIAAHINLAAVALGIGSVDSSSIYDDEAHEALEIDGVYEALVHTIVLGAPG